MRRRWVAAAVVWLVVCGGVACAAIVGLLSVKRLASPVEIENTYGALVAAQAFFLVFLWPLFERAPLDRESPARGVSGLLVRLVGLLVLAVPLVLIAVRTGDVSTAGVLWSQAFLLLVGVSAGAACRLPGAGVWYYPAAFLVAGVVPLLGYLLREEGGLSTEWAAVTSPLWAAGSLAAGGRVLWRMLVYGALAVGATAGLFVLGARGPADADHA